jgi:hypothetical protein
MGVGGLDHPPPPHTQNNTQQKPARIKEKENKTKKLKNDFDEIS